MSTAPDWLTAQPFAHRGLHDASSGCLENTMAAFDAAISRSFGIELDVQPSSDGTPVVFHDYTLDRLTDRTGPVSALSTSALSDIHVAGTDQTILPLASVLARIDGKAPVLVEMKSRFDGADDLARKTAACLSGYHGPAALMCFDPVMVALARSDFPALVRGIVACDFTDDAHWSKLPGRARRSYAALEHLDATSPHFIAYDCRELPAIPVERVRRHAPLPVLAWTVKDQATADRVAAHADQIIFEGFHPRSHEPG